FDDDAAGKNTFRAHDNTIPAAIYSLAKNGISPPLTLFLPLSLEKIRSSNVKTVKHGTGETTRVTVIDLAEFPDEDTLDQANFCTVWNTYLTFIETCSGKQIFESFARHFNQMLTDPGLALWFPAYRAFDRKIRAQFFTAPYIIDVEHAEYRSALQAAKNDFMMHTQASSRSGARSSSSGGRAAKERSERSKPYDKDNAPPKRTLCFRCGRTGHGAVTCREANPSKHGRNFVIYANRGGLFRIHDDHAVCMSFNCGKCESSGNTHALHICSLCSDAHHGAVNCTRN
ncbi:hypothetical protein GGX14DRAFT_315778, partial [Mycena pura]